MRIATGPLAYAAGQADYINFFCTPQRKHVGNARLSPIAFNQRQKLKLQGV